MHKRVLLVGIEQPQLDEIIIKKIRREGKKMIAMAYIGYRTEDGRFFAALPTIPVEIDYGPSHTMGDIEEALSALAECQYLNKMKSHKSGSKKYREKTKIELESSPIDPVPHSTRTA